jgi:hypothetical protein
MFLDDELFKFATTFPKEEEYFHLMMYKLHELCNNHWLPIVKVGEQKRVALNKLNQTIKYWDLFMEKIKFHDYSLYTRISDYGYGDYIKDTDMFKMLNQ